MTTQSIFIPRGTGKAFIVRRGEILRVSQPPGGGQVGDLNAFNLTQPKEHFWASRTGLRFRPHLTVGDQLFSSAPWERPMLTLIADTIPHQRTSRGGWPHDVFFGRCSRQYLKQRYGDHYEQPGCQENLSAAIAQFGLAETDVHDAFNLFMITGIDQEGIAFLEECTAKEHDHVDLQAEMDCLVAISACPGKCTLPNALGLQIEVFSR